MARTGRVERVVAAEPARVFAAFTDPDDLVAWLPPTGMTGRFEHAAGISASLDNLERHLRPSAG